jgi:hypothetical protein
MHDNDPNQDLDELIRRSAQVEVPADVEQRLRGRLAEFRTRVEQRPPSRLRALAYSLIHPPALRVMAMTAALLVAVAVALVFVPGGSSASRVYAAAVAQLRNARSLQYTMVLNSTPYVAVDFSYVAPGYSRANCSWGIEVRGDAAAGRQLILMHATRTYLTEDGKKVESLADSAELMEQLKSLPLAADEVIGEQQAGGKRLIGYRVRKAPLGSVFPGLKVLDLWVDAGTRAVDHVDIVIQEEGKPPHQMHITDIRVDAEINRSLFDLTPPAGYTAIQPAPSSSARPLRAEIGQAPAQTAVVMSMRGPYTRTQSALQAVEAHLRSLGVTPVGPPFARYESEQHWDAGYPVPLGTRVEAPFQLVSLPEAMVATAVVKGPWGKAAENQWGTFVISLVEQGYAVAGPLMEIWSGEDAKPAAQSTELRIPVKKTN